MISILFENKTYLVGRAVYKRGIATHETNGDEKRKFLCFIFIFVAFDSAVTIRVNTHSSVIQSKRH